MPNSTRTSTSSPTPQARPRVSALEQTYGQFYPSTIAKAEATAGGAGRLMHHLNQIHEMVAGLSAVLRIVAGNQVVEDQFAPDNPTSAPPLSKTTEYMLTAMAASLCERMRDDIELSADTYNSRVQS